MSAPASIPTSPSVELQLAAIEELSEISKEILLQPDVRQEVYDVAMQPRYLDRYIALSHLLEPRNDAAEELKPARKPGAFAGAFYERFTEERYPALAEYLPSGELSSRGDGPSEELYLYCPYCENYTDEQVAAGFTVAPNLSVVASNTEPGSEPQADGTYETVSVNDHYAALNPTLILTGQPDGGLLGTGGDIITICNLAQCCDYEFDDSGSSPTQTLIRCYPNPNGGPTGPTPPRGWEDCVGFDGVWTGNIQVTKQYDALFGLTNTGGSEMRLGRIGDENMFIQANGHVNASGFSTLIGYYMSRSRISDRRTMPWTAEFDPNWACDEPPQRFIYYEEDNVSTTTINASVTLSASVKVKGLTVAAGRTIGYTTTIASQDAIIWMQTYARPEFFAGNRLSRGCGTLSGWAKYSCNEGFITLPERYY